MKHLFTGFLIAMSPLLVTAHSIDFDKIEHWTGTGPNRAALVVQFGGKYAPSDVYVWGYRWEDEKSPNGEEMFKAICEDSSELVILTQYTGQYGATLCGVGFGDTDVILDKVYFDFEMALDYPFISFDYYHNNSWFGQEEAPGENTPAIMQLAIDQARKAHVIQHPLDYFSYGYPAYDYDCWKMNDEDSNNLKWQAGWYEGYWSFWIASENRSSEWIYSGTGFTGAELRNGTIHGWTYTQFEEAMIGGMGEGNPPTDNETMINYRPSDHQEETNIPYLELKSSDIVEYYTISGHKILPDSGYKGLVIVKTKDKTYKTIFN